MDKGKAPADLYCFHEPISSSQIFAGQLRRMTKNNLELNNSR